MAVTDSVWPKTSILDAIKLHDLGKDQGAQMLRVKYGEMLVKGQIVSNLKEQKIIKLIMKLHNDGQSFRQIAKYLNDKKLKAKRGPVGQVCRDFHCPPSTGGKEMKAVAEIVAAIILLVSGSYIAPSLIKEFKVETIKSWIRVATTSGV